MLGNSDGEDTAWGAGIEIGDKKEWVKLGFGWFHIEANALIDSFIDSDLFDGKTNRQGLVAYAERQVWKNTDLALTFFNSQEIERDPIFAGALADFDDNVSAADRLRIQVDLKYKWK